MKLNEFKQHQKLDELQLSNLIGDYGAAATQQVGNRLFRKGGAGNLSVQDKMTKNIFINDFIGRATETLRSSIESGLVDPNATGSTMPNNGQTTPVNTPQPTTPTPNQPTPTNPVVAKTPAEIRAEKLKANADAAQSQMAPFSKLKPTVPKTPEEIRAEKLKANADAAQSQMAANPVPTNRPATTPAGTVNKAKAGNPNIAGQTPYVQGRAGRGKNPTKFAKFNPSTSAMANLAKGVGNMSRGKQIQRESTFNKLNYIFESIMNVDEADPVAQKRSISQHLLNWFKQYMKMGQLPGDAQTQLQTLANEVQSTWGKDKGKGALTKLANLAYTLAQSAEEREATTGQSVATPLDTLKTSPRTSASTTTATTSASDANSASAIAPTVAPTTASKTIAPSTTTTTAGELTLAQIKQAIDKLPAKSKQLLLKYLQTTSTSNPVVTKTKPKATKPTPTGDTGAGANAFSQMATQLKKPKPAAEPAYTPPAKMQKMKAAKQGGPTPDEEAKLQQRIQQQLAKQK